MPKPVPFIHKLVKNLDRIDRETLQDYVLDLAEENWRYDQMLQHIKEGVILVDRAGRIRFINQQAGDWLQIDSQKAENRRLAELISDPELLSFVQEHLPGLKEQVVGNFQVLSPRELRLRLFLTTLDNLKESLILILMTQVSSDRPLESVQKRSVSAEALMSLAVGIAHEIGNPLNSISIQLQLLKKEIKGVPAPKRISFEKTLDVIQAETQRLDRIVKNFLKAARRPPLRFKSENLNQVLEEAIYFVKPELEEQGIAVQFKADPELPHFLMDRERLRQAFINLLKNAMEAMHRPGLISIHVSHRDHLALVRFKDEGVGIKEGDLPHIFEAYFTTKDEGSGLGLMVVLNAIQEHGGRIEVRSKVGRGSTFILLLPIRGPKLQLPQYKTRVT